MDYKEEQQSEIEALESIYPNEFELIATEPYEIAIEAKSEGFDDGRGLNCRLKFRFTPTYPDETPEIEIDEDEDSSNLDEDERLTLSELLEKEASENTGMAMIFTLVSATLEWLNVRWERKLQEEEEEEERRRKEEEEAEHKRFEGTRVTVQTFIAWKTTFDAEMALKRKDEELVKEKESSSKKLTGRELFMQDKTLIESDLQFTEDEGAIPIDESLFEDMEDLDIGDEEDDDEEEED